MPIFSGIPLTSTHCFMNINLIHCPEPPVSSTFAGVPIFFHHSRRLVTQSTQTPQQRSHPLLCLSNYNMSRVRDTIPSGDSARRTQTATKRWNQWRDIEHLVRTANDNPVLNKSMVLSALNLRRPGGNEYTSCYSSLTCPSASSCDTDLESLTLSSRCEDYRPLLNVQSIWMES